MLHQFGAQINRPKRHGSPEHKFHSVCVHVCVYLREREQELWLEADVKTVCLVAVHQLFQSVPGGVSKGGVTAYPPQSWTGLFSELRPGVHAQLGAQPRVNK